MQNEFSRGQIVKFTECIEPGDDSVRFVVIEPRGDRVLVEMLNSGMCIAPQSVYTIGELTHVQS